MNFYKTFRVLDSVYLWLLGIGVGCIVACGMFAAPVVFKASSFIYDLALLPASCHRSRWLRLSSKRF